MYNKEIKKSILLVFLINIISIRRESNLKNLLKYFKGSAIVFAILAPLSMIVEVVIFITTYIIIKNYRCRAAQGI